MLHRLTQTAYERVRPLMGDLTDYHVAIDGVLQAHNPGAVYGDDPTAPQIVFITGPEGAYLGGQVPPVAQRAALNAWLSDLMTQPDMGALWLAVTPQWEDHLADLFPRPPLRQPRQHYACTKVTLDWRARLPDNMAVQPITRDLITRLELPEHVHGWMEDNWGSRDNFLARGFGFVTIDTAQNRVASWSLCDCISRDAARGNTCEIGIRTDPAYRERGLAAITAAAAVEHALAHGYQSVGWHCNMENIGSRRTALKVGFSWERDYVHHVSFHSEAIHWAEAGRMQMADAKFPTAAAYYARAAEAADQPPWSSYIPVYAAGAYARAGDHAAAWEWLHRAAASGFADGSFLDLNAAFDPLKTTAEWSALLSTINSAKK